MYSRFKKLIKKNHITELDDNYSYGDVIGDVHVTIENDLGTPIAKLEYVKEISIVTLKYMKSSV